MFDCGANDITLSLANMVSLGCMAKSIDLVRGSRGGLYDWDHMGYSIAGIDDCAGKRTVLDFGGSPRGGEGENGLHSNV